jgi:hypothetical protein
MDPELVAEFAAEYHRELNRLNAAREDRFAQQKEELARVERQIRAIIEAVKEGLRTSGMKDELLALEARKVELAAAVRQAPPPAPRLHPRLAEIYRAKVADLQAELNRPELRAESSVTRRKRSSSTGFLAPWPGLLGKSKMSPLMPAPSRVKGVVAAGFRQPAPRECSIELTDRVADRKPLKKLIFLIRYPIGFHNEGRTFRVTLGILCPFVLGCT